MKKKYDTEMFSNELEKVMQKAMDNQLSPPDVLKVLKDLCSDVEYAMFCALYHQPLSELQ